MMRHAQTLLKEVLLFETPPALILSRYFKEHRQLGSRDRMSLSNIVYKVLREKRYFEFLIENFPSSLSKENALTLLGVQDSPEWIKRYSTPQELEWLGLVQKNADTLRVPELTKLNLPDWLADALKEQLGDEFEIAAASLQENAHLDLRVNAIKSKRTHVQKELAESGIETQFTPYSQWGLRVNKKMSLTEHPLYENGSIEIQDEGSQLLASLVGAKRNEIIVDYCAGAGGKTLALGAMMRNTGRVYAWDIVGYRLSALKPRLERSGLTNVFTAILSSGDEERVRRLYGKADRVLVDAPCSGLGTLRRAPELKWRQTLKTVSDLAQVQSLILNDACRLVKEGGFLIYATCSLLRQENEEIAHLFSVHHPEFVQIDVVELLKQQKIADYETMVNQGCLRLWPHRHQTDGFFAAVWKRVS